MTLLLHSHLNRKFFYYVTKYAQYIHNVILIKDLFDDNGSTTAPYLLATGQKPAAKHFRVFGFPAVFKPYEVSNDGKLVLNKYTQHTR